MATIGLVGDGPALDAVRAALTDTDATPTTIAPPDVSTTDIVTIAGRFDDETLTEAADAAHDAAIPHLVIELGGIGGHPVTGVTAAISGHTTDSTCYRCLCGRVNAAAPATDDGDIDIDRATARYAGALAGHELTGLLEDRPAHIIGTVREIPHTDRRLLPLPFCRCAPTDTPAGLVPQTDNDRSLSDAIARAEQAFDDRIGPIATIGEAESYPTPYYLAELTATPFSDADVPDHAAGVAADWNPAYMKALGEALERYSAAVYRDATFTSAGPDCLDPARFVQPDPRVETEDVTRWYPAEDIQTHSTVQVPAELVVFPPPERTIRPAITTGLGLGNDGVTALLSGLYEVIERDAAMLAWYSTYQPLGLQVADPTYQTLAKRARSESLQTTAVLLTQDIDIPVVAVCVYRDDDWPRFATGLAAHIDPATAARDGLAEAIQNWMELRRMGPDTAADQSGAIGHYADFPPIAADFVSPDTTIAASTLAPASDLSGPTELTTVIDVVTTAGLDIYAARLTPRDIEQLGFETVRILIPAAQPLFTDTAYFGDRARTIPTDLGFVPQPDRDHHPYP